MEELNSSIHEVAVSNIRGTLSWGENVKGAPLDFKAADALGEIAKMFEGQTKPDMKAVEERIKALQEEESKSHNKETDKGQWYHDDKEYSAFQLPPRRRGRLTKYVDDVDILPASTGRKRERSSKYSTLIYHDGDLGSDYEDEDTNCNTRGSYQNVNHFRQQHQQQQHLQQQQQQQNNIQRHTLQQLQHQHYQQQFHQLQQRRGEPIGMASMHQHQQQLLFQRQQYMNRMGYMGMGLVGVGGMGPPYSMMMHQPNINPLMMGNMIPAEKSIAPSTSTMYDGRRDEVHVDSNLVGGQTFAPSLSMSSIAHSSFPTPSALMSISPEEIYAFYQRIHEHYGDASPQIINIFVDTIGKFTQRKISSLCCASLLQGLFREKPEILHHFLELGTGINMKTNESETNSLSEPSNEAWLKGSTISKGLLHSSTQNSSSNKLAGSNRLYKDTSKNIIDGEDVEHYLLRVKEALSPENYLLFLDTMTSLRNVYYERRFDSIPEKIALALSILPANAKDLRDQLERFFPVANFVRDFLGRSSNIFGKDVPFYSNDFSSFFIPVSQRFVSIGCPQQHPMMSLNQAPTVINSLIQPLQMPIQQQQLQLQQQQLQLQQLQHLQQQQEQNYQMGTRYPNMHVHHHNTNLPPHGSLPRQ